MAQETCSMRLQIRSQAIGCCCLLLATRYSGTRPAPWPLGSDSRRLRPADAHGVRGKKLGLFSATEISLAHVVCES